MALVADSGPSPSPVTPEGRVFPRYRFAGTHREIGRQFGDACVEPIHRHLALALTRLERYAKLSRDDALARALAYRPHILRDAPFFDEEIQGIAAGARLSLPEAYLLQLRAELAVVRPGAPADHSDEGDECTTFAVQPEATANGIGLAGQNADLPAFYGGLAVVAEIVPDDAPRVLMLTPAGQVSYVGINDRGLGVFANYLTCDGWREGFPRYLFSRLALTHETVDEAIAAVRGVTRASSRNLIILDTHRHHVHTPVQRNRNRVLRRRPHPILPLSVRSPLLVLPLCSPRLL